MSKTVSFRASEELDEFLEQEAERRMTTKSAAAQMLLAERVKKIKSERGEQQTLDQSTGDDSTNSTEEASGESGLPEVMQKHSDKWYEPDGEKNNYAVDTADGRRRYYKTQEGAAERLRDDYE